MGVHRRSFLQHSVAAVGGAGLLTAGSAGAGSESDPQKRAEMYFEAEKILCVDEAVIMPIYYYTRMTMTKPYLERTFDKGGGNEEIWAWKVKAH